jgi:hypothetical protein
MNSDSKKRHELEKQITARIKGGADIGAIEKVATYLSAPKKWALVETTTSLPSDFDSQKLILSFVFLNKGQCVYKHFDQAKGRKLVDILEQVANCELTKFPELKLARDSVERKDPYNSLFSHLSNDVQSLQETELGDGRVFFFITEPYFHIVSIETCHR